MKTLALFVFFFAPPIIANPPAEPDVWDLQLAPLKKTIDEIDTRRASGKENSLENAAIATKRDETVKEIERIGTSNSANPIAQLAVGSVLASVQEAPRAVPYAERGLRLAETSGDRKLIREALLAGSEIHFKAGDYEIARDRAQRILKNDPRDKEALALYMQAKGRSSATAPANSGGPRKVSSSDAPANVGGPVNGVDANVSAGATGRNGTATALPAPRMLASMTSASLLEVQRHLAAGWSLINLDAKAALKSFDAAVAADAKNAAARAQRSKARLIAGDPAGALEDADFAVSLDPGLGEAYAARVEAKRALGRAETDLLADFETAAKLDGRFTDAYKTALRRGGTVGGGTEGSSRDAATHGGLSGFLATPPAGWRIYSAAIAAATILGVVLAAFFLKRRRSDEGDSSPR